MQPASKYEAEGGCLSECLSNGVPCQSVLGFQVFSNDLDEEKKSIKIAVDVKKKKAIFSK